MNNLQPDVEASNLELQIKDQEDVVAKAEKKLKNLKDDQESMEKKIKDLQDDLKKNTKRPGRCSERHRESKSSITKPWKGKRKQLTY